MKMEVPGHLSHPHRWTVKFFNSAIKLYRIIEIYYQLKVSNFVQAIINMYFRVKIMGNI